MAKYGVDYLNRLVAATEHFEEAFERWMATQGERDLTSARGLYPTVWTKDDQDPAEVHSLEMDVAEAAVHSDNRRNHSGPVASDDRRG